MMRLFSLIPCFVYISLVCDLLKHSGCSSSKVVASCPYTIRREGWPLCSNSILNVWPCKLSEFSLFINFTYKDKTREEDRTLSGLFEVIWQFPEQLLIIFISNQLMETVQDGRVWGDNFLIHVLLEYRPGATVRVHLCYSLKTWLSQFLLFSSQQKGKKEIKNSHWL
jgi:hypothetical protein